MGAGLALSYTLFVLWMAKNHSNNPIPTVLTSLHIIIDIFILEFKINTWLAIKENLLSDVN